MLGMCIIFLVEVERRATELDWFVCVILAECVVRGMCVCDAVVATQRERVGMMDGCGRVREGIMQGSK
jgi:hypothetical protein